jgi:hypothetical protein
LEGWISPLERAAEHFGCNGDARLGEGLHGSSAPSYLLCCRALVNDGLARYDALPTATSLVERVVIENLSGVKGDVADFPQPFQP